MVIFILLLPLLILITFIVFLETKSPFFIQERVGKNKEPFSLVKFRTMKVNTANVASHLVGKSAITKTGQFLRKTKLDEIPQLLNVIGGTMSLVGPRPCLPSQEELIRERETRGVFLTRPGITGIAQINRVDMSQPRRLARYDAVLIKNFSLRLYFYCLIATFLGKGSGDTIDL